LAKKGVWFACCRVHNTAKNTVHCLTYTVSKTGSPFGRQTSLFTNIHRAVKGFIFRRPSSFWLNLFSPRARVDKSLVAKNGFGTKAMKGSGIIMLSRVQSIGPLHNRIKLA